MTTKDYGLIARAIKNVADSPNADKDTLRMLIANLHYRFQKDNPNYRGRTFETACGITV